MKKLFALVLVMVLVLSSLTACSVDEIKGKVTETFNTVKEKVTDTFDTVKKTVGGWFGIEFPDEDPPVTYDVEAAKDYVYQLYVKGSYETPVDYQVVKQVFIKKVAHDVTWTTSSELVKVIVNENDVTIDVDEKATEDLVYTITATITGGDGTSATISFERMVPKYELLGYAQYLEKATGEAVTVEGIVTLARSQAAGNKRDQLFIQDMNGINGYYVYYTDKDYVDELGLKVGMKVSVTGIKEIYGKTHEIKEGVVTILDETITTLTPNDITDLFKTNTDPKATALLDRLGSLVTIKGVVIGGQDLGDSAKYLYFEMEGGCETYVRVYTTDLGIGVMNAEQEAQVFADHLAKRDYLANVTGVVDVYSDAIYISPVGPTPFEFLTKVERTPAEKIEISLDELEVPKSIEKAGEITLPTAGTTYPEVSFAWSSSNNDVIAVDGGKLTVTLPEETTTVTLTLKANCTGATEVVKTFDITVYAPSADLYVPVVVDKVEAEKPFKLILSQANLGKTLYFAGDVADVTYRLATTDDANKAADVYLEKVTAEGSTDVIGYRLYFFKGETKTYIRIYERTAGEATQGKGSLELVTTAPAEYYTYDETFKTLVLTSADAKNKYFLGTYDTFDTISCSNVEKYLNADSLDKTQFPVHFATLEPKQVEPVVKTPEAEKPFKLVLLQANLGKALYFAGDVADVNYRLATTDKLSKAVDVYLEKVLGEDGTTLLGYRLYFFKGETKTYIRIYERTAGEATQGKGSLELVTTAPAEVYTYDETFKTLVLTSADAKNKYFLGTYDTFDTISCSNVEKYLNADSLDKTQFPVHFATIEFVKDEVVEPDEPDTPDTPDEPEEKKVEEMDLTTTTLGIGSSYGNGTAKITGIGFEYIELGDYGNGIQMRTKNGKSSTLWNTVAFASGIQKIELTYNAAKLNATQGALKTISNAIKFTFGNEMGADTYTVSLNTVAGQGTYTITPDKDTYTFFKLLHTASNAFYFDTIKIYYYELPEASDAEKVAAEKEALALDMTKVNLDRVITLPTAKEYTDVAITWAVSENTVATLADGKLTVTTGAKAEKITLTATLKCGDVTETKTFEVEVAAKSPITVTKVTAPVAGVAYKIYLRQFIADNVYFVNGNIVSSKYLGTTTAITGAIDVYVEVAEGGFKFYGGTDNNRMYVNVDKDGKISLAATDGNVFKYDAEKNCWYTTVVTSAEGAETVTTKDYYLGSYKDYNTISASELKYITKDNTGITQFPAELVTFVCSHVWDAECDTTCDVCGETRQAAAAHTYDALCTDADCNLCGETRQVPTAHTFDDDCADTTCNVEGCTGTREAKQHVYDADCTDATCNNEGCQVTRTAAEAHVYDADCTDATCNNAGCQVTREAKQHAYDDDCTDATCNNEGCAVTREAKEHVYDNDCTDTTCANCAVTREAKEHEFADGCTDTTCENCAYVREGASHYFPFDCSEECSKCGANNPDAVECVDVLDKSGETPVEGHDNHCDHCGGDMDQTGDTPPDDIEA